MTYAAPSPVLIQKIAETPEIQEVMELGPPLLDESEPSKFVPTPVVEAPPVVEYVKPAPESASSMFMTTPVATRTGGHPMTFSVGGPGRLLCSCGSHVYEGAAYATCTGGDFVACEACLVAYLQPGPAPGP